MARPRKIAEVSTETATMATAVLDAPVSREEHQEAVQEAITPPSPPATEYYDVHLLYGVVRCCVVNDRVVSAGHRMDWMVGKHIHDLKTQVYNAGGTIRRVGVER